MNVCSIDWVACLLLFSALFFLVPGVGLRQVFLASCNLGFVATLVSSTDGWIALAAFSGAGYIVARALGRFPRKIILVIYLVVLLSAFVILKQYAFVKLLLPQALFQKVIAAVGLSYMLFRQIQWRWPLTRDRSKI